MFSILFIEFSTLAESSVIFLHIKPKKLIKLEKYTDFGFRLGKLVSNLKINITKIEKRPNLKNLW